MTLIYSCSVSHILENVRPEIKMNSSLVVCQDLQRFICFPWSYNVFIIPLFLDSCYITLILILLSEENKQVCKQINKVWARTLSLCFWSVCILMDIFVGALSFMVFIDKHNKDIFLKKNYLSRKDLLSDENRH